MTIDHASYGRAGRQRSFAPTLGPDDQHRLINALNISGGVASSFAKALRDLARQWVDDGDSLELRAISLLVADLYEQGWSVQHASNHIVFEPPGLARNHDETVMMVKARVQRALQVGRDRQLREPSVRQFIARMERSVPRGEGTPTSVLDLIDEGDSLANALAAVRALPEDRRLAALKKIVDPQIEVCDASSRCRESELPLIDVWRYFRHTWSHEYRSMPGRQMMILIRNAARPRRPIMGIAMLASPVMRLSARDQWIGWVRPAAQKLVLEGGWKAPSFVYAMHQRIKASLADIRWDDLATAEEIATPTEAVVFRLQQKASGAAYQRQIALKATYRAGGRNDLQRDPIKHAGLDFDWRKASEDLLFVRKRAEGLAELLYARLVLREFDLTQPTPETLLPLFASKRGQRAIDVVLTELRKAGLSSRVADVSVCGAVHPYNEILGGKLVALMLTSREMRDAYTKRYGGHVSIIASQMAGRPIVKLATLKILTTTSLYGVGSSQYNRLTLRAEVHRGIPFDIRWQAIEKGLTGGYGTLHLSADTVHAMRQMAERRHDSRRINNRFGEGTSPRLRQIREGLEALGVDSDKVLHHATPRIFYGCELEPAARSNLLSTLERATPRAPSAAAIGEAWRRRWLTSRIDNTEIDVLARMRALGADSVRATLRVDDNLVSEDKLDDRDYLVRQLDLFAKSDGSD